MFNGAVKKLGPVERKYQEDVERKIVIASIQDKLPKISKQNGALDRDEKEEKEEKGGKEEKEVQCTDKEDKKGQDQHESLDQKQDQESSESTEDPGEEQ